MPNNDIGPRFEKRPGRLFEQVVRVVEFGCLQDFDVSCERAATDQWRCGVVQSADGKDLGGVGRPTVCPGRTRSLQRQIQLP